MANKPLRIQSMFSGIGGLDLGVERAIHAVTVAQCELNAYARSVLKRHWSDAELTDDVCTLKAVDGMDVLVAGFPCQDASKANPKGQKGLAGKKTGLWSEVLRLVHEGNPDLVVLENVRNLLNVGFETVLQDLDQAGYDVRWGVWTVAAVGGPSCRERLITVALKRGTPAAAIPVRDHADIADPFTGSFEALPEHTSGAWDPDPSVDPSKFAGMTARAKAIGNAVSPAVATTSLVQTLAHWDELGGALKAGKKLPAFGAQQNGVLRAFVKLAPSPSYDKDFDRGDFVRWTDGMGIPQYDTLRSCIGRVIYANGDFMDIELPGGSVEPFDAESVKRWWPTPTAHDAQDSNSVSQYKRKSPGLPSFTDGIACPTTAEWSMGLPLGWTMDHDPNDDRKGWL